jgi:acylphosphatase
MTQTDPLEPAPWPAVSHRRAADARGTNGDRQDRQVQAGERARLHIWVSGRVQGVSFRAFVQQTGMMLGLTGWVRNVGYDQVETLAEGERAALEEFAQAVQSGPRGSHVEAARVEWETPTGEFRWFDVKHSV